ncbi:methyltransferase [Anaerolineales bacterium HSG6]|nr:methyltransferase [Anaerolineales bacterium HSG6]
MNSYQRIFGTGPRGTIISIALLGVAYWLKPVLGLPSIIKNKLLRYSLFGALLALTVAVISWSVRSLPPTDRGRNLVTNGAFHYFRHPLYGAFLTFFNFGLAILLNNWIYVLWATAQHPVWHWNIRGEEALMRQYFPDEYDNYCQQTGRFVPRI